MDLTPRRLIRLLLWLVLGALALVGAAAIAIFVVFYVEHVQNCRPPPSLDGTFRADCVDAETVMHVMLVYGAPLALPLILALGVRALGLHRAN